MRTWNIRFTNDTYGDGQGELVNIQILEQRSAMIQKKAERFFKERRIKFQFIDMKKRA